MELTGLSELLNEYIKELDDIKRDYSDLNSDLLRPEWKVNMQKFKRLPLGPAQTMSAIETIGNRLKISVPLKLYNEIWSVYDNRAGLEFGYEMYSSKRMMYLMSTRGELRNMEDTVSRWSISGCDSSRRGCFVCERLIEASKECIDHINKQHWDFTQYRTHQDHGIATQHEWDL